MTFSFRSKSILIITLAFSIVGIAQTATNKAKPVFKNGEAQIIEAFSNPETWIRHDLWVETNFDTDGDGDVSELILTDARGVFRPSGIDLDLGAFEVQQPVISGTNNADSLSGSNVSDSITGMDGNDLLNGLAAIDFIQGGSCASFCCCCLGLGLSGYYGVISSSSIRELVT